VGSSVSTRGCGCGHTGPWEPMVLVLLPAGLRRRRARGGGRFGR
jgi:hypothetical protein